MRCIECKTDPLTPGHYCECCGRKLSIEERTPVQAAAADTRCGSCGGPSAGRDLCASCEQAFGPVLGSTTPAPLPVVADRPPATKLKSDAVQAQAVKKEEAAKPASAMPEAPKPEKVRPPRPPMPVASTSRPTTSGSSHRRTGWILAAGGAVVIVAAMATPQGIRWFENQQLAQAVHDEQPEPKAVVVEKPASPETAVKGRESAPARPRNTSSEPLKPATPARPPAVVRASANVAPQRESKPAIQVASSARSAATESSAPAPPPPVRPVAAEARPSAAPAEPAGKFFEPREVDESPAIATRVDPKLPADGLAGLRNDIVIVRLLVSQSGHPFRVSLLRKSKAGRSVDDAVVAAVTHWTFSPARKRGEAVSCWLNVAVPLGQAS